MPQLLNIMYGIKEVLVVTSNVGLSTTNDGLLNKESDVARYTHHLSSKEVSLFYHHVCDEAASDRELRKT